jgi:Protein of unknown function (DUF3551)
MPRTTLALFTFCVAIALTSAMSTPARAEIQYPWCAVYGMAGDLGTNCGFSTLEQCRATVSGIGGSCEPNQFYKGPVTNGSGQQRKKKRH